MNEMKTDQYWNDLPPTEEKNCHKVSILKFALILE